MSIKKNLVTLAFMFRNTRFLSAAVILAVCAVVLNPAITALSQNCGKKPVPIRKLLKDFDISKLSSFQNGWKSKQNTAPVKDLQTDEYVHLAFTNPANIPPRAELYVTYYSNPADKVGHTPEVCARQGGAIVNKLSTITIDTPQLAPGYEKIKARFIIFEESNYYFADIYVFFVEGKFRHTREQVRWTLAMPGNHHTYFSKIETAAVFTNPEDKNKSVQAAIQLLQEALPELLDKHFPTIQQIKKP